MKTFLTDRTCSRCGSNLHTSDIKGYPLVCKKCDENMYLCESKEFHVNNNVAVVGRFEVSSIEELQKHFTHAHCISFDPLSKTTIITYSESTMAEKCNEILEELQMEEI